MHTYSRVTALVRVASVVMGLASFTAFYLSGHDLTAEIIFPSLYLFEMLTLPLLDIPMSLSLITTANAAFKRIAVRLDKSTHASPCSFAPR